MSKEDIINYIKRNYKTPNIAILQTLGATDELIKYLINTPNNTNIKTVESLINGSESEKSIGIKSITISPAITTTPALESFFPIYYEDLTEEQKQNGVAINVATSAEPLPDGYTFTLVPTSDVYAGIDGIGKAHVVGDDKGEVVSVNHPNVPYIENAAFFATTSFEQPATFVEVILTVGSGK